MFYILAMMMLLQKVFPFCYALEDDATRGLLEIGPFVESEHAVSGTVFIKDNKTLIIRNFSYDGTVNFN